VLGQSARRIPSTEDVHSSTGPGVGTREARSGPSASTDALAQRINTRQRTPSSSPTVQTTRPQTQELHEDEDGIASLMVPRLIRSSERRRQQLSLSPDDLPPTPTQLGMATRPARPKGLLSSSPRGTKRRGSSLRQSTSAAASSPLRPKSQAPARHRSPEPLGEPASAREPSDARPEEQPMDEIVTEEVRNLERTLAELQSQQRKLQAGSKILEEALSASNAGRTIHLEKPLLNILQTAGQIRTTPSPIYDSDTTTFSPSNLLAHLRLFAPGDLNLESNSKIHMVDDRIKLIHHVTIRAPPPWPSHTYAAHFNVTTDPESPKVETITYDALHRPSGFSNELHKWIQSRLSNAAHARDLASLVWGIGAYFAAAIQRARFFAELRHHHNLDDSADHDAPRQARLADLLSSQKFTPDHAVLLACDLAATTIALPLPPNPSAHRDTKHSASFAARPRLHLRWAIDLSPTSRARSLCSIALTGTSMALAEAAPPLFATLVKVKGYRGAFDGVWELLVAQDGDGLVSGGVGGVGGLGKRARAQSGMLVRKKRKKVT
jgi:hypothetical protein